MMIIYMEISPQKNPLITAKDIEMMKIQATTLKTKNINKNDSIIMHGFN